MNFLENAQSLGLPEGYGSFQSRAEIDVLSAVTEQGLLDVARQQKKELEFEIQAKKVINKYNQTSSRIIQSNHVERKRDSKELLLAERPRPLEQQRLARPALDAQEKVSREEFLGLAQRFAASLGALTQAERAPPQLPSADEFRKSHQELLAAVNQSVKQLKSNNDIGAVKRRVPANVLDQLLYYQRKLKVLLRHCYAQLDKAHDEAVLARLSEMS